MVKETEIKLRASRATLAALREHGPCVEHRRSFAPVRECLEVPQAVAADIAIA